MTDIAFVAYSVTEHRGCTKLAESRWVRVGVAFEDDDSSLTLYLDATPLSGKLVLRRPEKEKAHI